MSGGSVAMLRSSVNSACGFSVCWCGSTARSLLLSFAGEASVSP